MSKLNTGTLEDIAKVAWMAAYGDTDKCIQSFSDGDDAVSLKSVLRDDGILPALVHYASTVSFDVSGESIPETIEEDTLHVGGEFSGVSILENSTALSGLSVDDSIDCSNGVANKVHFLLEAILFLCPKNSNGLYPNITNAYLYTDKIKEIIKEKKPSVFVFQKAGVLDVAEDIKTKDTAVALVNV